MQPDKRNPAPQAAGRASNGFCFSAERFEDTQNALALQIAYLSRRAGILDPATLAAIAALAFGEVRS